MTKDQQLEFVNDLMNNLRNEILRQIMNGKIPEDWDGIELRWLIAEHAQNSANIGTYDNRSKRKKDYNNTVIVNNL